MPSPNYHIINLQRVSVIEIEIYFKEQEFSFISKKDK